MEVDGSRPDFTNATWIEAGGPEAYCLAHPSSDLCDNVKSFYEYHIWLAPNAALLAVFAASLVANLATWALTRRAAAFNIALCLGLICEVLGYAGRLISWHNPWEETGFMIQICCLTIGPAFMAAGVYLCLRRIVAAFGPENSRIAPAYYTRIFIPCDVISLIFQALGGALASIASHNHKSATLGSNIMIVGLAFQVATGFAFIVASLDFALRTYRRSRAGTLSTLDQDPALVRLRASRRFRGFIAALSIAAVCILWRSSFRVAELSEGWSGPIMGDQGMFVGFEGVLIAVAVLVLNAFHPAFCIPELFNRDTRRSALRPKSLSDEESKPPTADGSYST